MRYLLFTTRFCHKCPKMKEYMAGQDKVNGAVVDASTPEGMEEAKRYNIQGVPTVVFLDEENIVLKKCSEKEEVEEFLNKH